MKITCPKCGELGNLEEHFVKVKEESGGKRKEYGYWRVVHYIKEGGRRKRVCYLGPINRDYVYVEKVHELGLTNVLHQDPARIVRKVVTKLIEEVGRAGVEERGELLEKVRRLRIAMEELLPKLRAIEEGAKS
jgi:hypothetical protein